ncbi:MAG: hypothetical protein NTW14_08850 [bacterium]|nr:hypothetical protein [bacterium]
MIRTLVCSLAAIAVLIGCAAADGIDLTFAPEGVQTASQKTELLLSDPLINQIIYYDNPLLLAKKREHWGLNAPGMGAGGFSVGLEAEVSGVNKSFSIPLKYTWHDVTLGVHIPYIYQRKMYYALATKEASGLGDVSFNLGYGRAKKGLVFSATLFSKLPTGDENKMVGGYLVPLGTGSLDWVFNLSVKKFLDKFAFSGNASLRINGTSDRTAEILFNSVPNTPDSIETVNYDIRNGNMFTLTGSFDYYLGTRWTLGTVLALSIVGEGSTDASYSYNWGAPGYSTTGLSNRQDMTLLDLTPMVSYDVHLTDLTLMAKLPLITRRNEANQEDDRGVSVLLRLSRTL